RSSKTRPSAAVSARRAARTSSRCTTSTAWPPACCPSTVRSSGPVRKFRCVPGRLQTVAWRRPRSATYPLVRGFPASLPCSVFAGHPRTNSRTEPLVLSRELKRLGTQSAIYGLGGVISRLIAIFLIPVYTVYLGRVGFGKIETITALTSVLVILLRMGITSAFFRFYFIYDED